LTLLLTITIQLSISISGLHEHVRTLNEEVSFLRLGAQQDSTAEISHGVVLVIVPAFNEQATITQVVDDIRTNGYDVLVISDGSTDDTVKMAINGGATVLDFRLNMGVGAALRAGFKYAHQNGYQAVVQVDADGQHLVSEIPKLLRPWKEDGFHLVIGSRFRSQGTTMVVSRSRRLAMNMLAFFASRAAHTTITDASSGFRLISQPLLGVFSTTFPASYLGDTYEALISAGKANYKIIEVPTAMSPRLVGVSSASTIKAFGLTVRALLVGILCFHIRISKYKTP
jgi:glycosyltransferase involved in cell wall biosynthesis